MCRRKNKMGLYLRVAEKLNDHDLARLFKFNQRK